ncbi:MAG: SUMF1/EgtB/PvdO family nonheme iron enzyme, partial [Candidatus Sericytochromatia bacterium]|nr:SUMF1/EgtB/PvdO family nonheme iron enzyme [Candidatus Tanganyikabacteria bacterium]
MAAVEPERIILCGSVARGAMGPDGDIDMGPLTDEIFLTLEGLGLPGDVIMATPEDRAFPLVRSWIRRFLEIGGNRRRPTRPGVARPGLTLAVAVAACLAAAVGAPRALAVSGRAVFLDGGVTIQFIWLPAGRFLSGSPADEPGRESDETQHPVKLTRGFYMQTTEVTQAQWQALVGKNPSYFTGDATRPVEQVSWWDAVAYANALSAAEGLSPAYSLKGCSGTPGSGNYSCSGISLNSSDGTPYGTTGYRLPTESEWEYAYRAGTSTAFYNGA